MIWSFESKIGNNKVAQGRWSSHWADKSPKKKLSLVDNLRFTFDKQKEPFFLFLWGCATNPLTNLDQTSKVLDYSLSLVLECKPGGPCAIVHVHDDSSRDDFPASCELC